MLDDRLGADPDRDVAVGDPAALEREVARRHASAVRTAADQVHRRAPDEAGDEQVRRPSYTLLRRPELLELAVRHHRDPVAERHRLDLVVRDVDRRDAQARVQALQLGAHLDAELRVEVRERLVEQERASARARAPGPSRRAGAARRRAAPAGVSAGRRGRASCSPHGPGGRSPPSASCAASVRTRGSCTRSCAGRARSSGRPSRCRGRAASRRSRRGRRRGSCPLVGFSRPATHRRAVVFPQPDGPTRIMNSPSATSSDRSSSATVPPGKTLFTCSKTTSATSLSLQSGRRDPADEPPLGHEEQQQQRKHAHHVRRHQQVRVRSGGRPGTS